MDLPKPMGAERKTLASSLVCNSSNKESGAWDISSLTETNVRLRSSVTYVYLSRRGRAG